jgi:imidazolonepropionase
MAARRFDQLWTGVNLATMTAAGAAYGAIPDGALGVKDGRIAWVGRRADLDDAAANLGAEVIDGDGGWLTPGLIDCHTHLVYGGNRAREFEMRLQGVAYEEIARQGGGILSTVKATRALDENGLVRASRGRLDALIADGATTVEVKTGYGLNLADELKCLRAARRLGEEAGVEIAPTLLAAHAVPPEFSGRADDYVDLVCNEIIPAAVGLAEAVDVFCEGIGFSTAQTARVFDAAKKHGLAIKGHTEQLSNLGGSALAASYGAWSVDHVEHLDDDGVAALARSGTVAVLLPGAFYFLRETKLPPIGALRAAGVKLAIATDVNPGTSPFASLRLTLNMACTLFRLTPEEALAGLTRNAALALGRGATHGTLEVGKHADLCLWAVGHPAELAYEFGANPLRRRVFRGR